MKIIEQGVVPIYRQQCDHCKTVFDYALSEASQHSYVGWLSAATWANVVCPGCCSVLTAEFEDAPL